MEDGTHWESGRWAHYILPYEGGLHVYNVYGYDSTDKQAPEKNREILLEVMGSPDDFPIDLAHGASVHRPVSDEAATSPVKHGVDTADNGTMIDWFLVSKSLLPTTGLEEALHYKPDHSVVQIQLDLKKIAQAFHGQPDYEEPTETDGITIASRYLEAKARHSGAWTC
eukprot:74101-Amphidinium_carterae.1